MLLLTLITTALAYPYAPYYQPYILGAPLVGPTPSAAGSAGAKPTTGGRGGMGMSPFGMGFPFGGIQGFLNMFFPGFASNPAQLFMMDSAMDGDIAEASEKYMQGDFSEAMDKIYDSGDLMPLMAYGRNALSGLTGRGATGAAGASGATGGKPTTGAQSGGINPYMWASLIDLKRPRVAPVLSAPRPRTYIQPVVYPNGAVQYFPVNPVNGRLQQLA